MSSLSPADVDRLDHILRKEFRVPCRPKSLLEAVDPDDFADLMVWWDQAEQEGGWDTRPPRFLLDLPLAIDMTPTGLKPEVIKPGQTYSEGLFTTRWGQLERTRHFTKQVDEELRSFKTWHGDESKAVARFVQIKKIDLERYTRETRTYHLTYLAWWSVIAPHRLEDAPESWTDLHLSDKITPHALIGPVLGSFKISHLIHGHRFQYVGTNRMPHFEPRKRKKKGEPSQRQLTLADVV